MSVDTPASRRFPDALFYCISGVCGLVTGVIGAGFHLIVNEWQHWPEWLVDRMPAGPNAR